MADFDLRVRRTQAFAAYERGDFKLAFQLGSNLLRGRKQDVALLEMLGVSAARTRRVGLAEQYLRKAIKAQPKKALSHIVLAEVYAQMGRLDEALERYDRALALEPRSAAAISGKAGVLERRGDLEKARELLQPHVEAGHEDAHMAAVLATIEQSEGRFGETIDLILRHLARPGIDFGARSRLCALAAKAYEKTGEHDKAFEAFAMSNRVIAKPFDPQAYIDDVDTLIAVFSRENLAMLPACSDRTDLPVFIACMPRSGSTLCEQIVHAHPLAFGAGEISELEDIVRELPALLDSIQTYPACLGDLLQERSDALGARYIAHLRSFDARVKRITNKHLDNYLHLGMAALLCPGARVIHSKRHPLDNCFSIYMAAMSPDTYPWATDLAHIGLAYRQYERLMAHWRDVLDLEVLDVQYEDLVADPDRWIRTIIEFCGLPWDDRCLRYYEAERDVMTLSYDQVRRPVYKSAVKRYEKYDAHLSPLKAALEAAD